MPEDKYRFLKIVLGVLISLDVIIWASIIISPKLDNEIYFLDVGQGDSSLIMTNGIKVLIDGGPIGGGLQNQLNNVLGTRDRYIDLVLVSHPQLDHFGGLIGAVKNYNVGVVVTSDEDSNNSAWREFIKIIEEKEIPRIVLFAGDKIRYLDNQFIILSPGKDEWVKNVNDMSLVVFFENKNIRVLFTGDIGNEKEKQLADLYDIDIDVLKVAHHGSRFSSNLSFLKEASPKISIIEVGKNNYGHPTKQVLGRLADIGSQIYRTDENGIVKLSIAGEKLKVYSQK